MNDTPAAPSPASARANRAVLWTIGSLAALEGVATVVIGAITLVTQITSGRFDVTLVANTPLPAAADAGTAQLHDGTFTLAEVTVSQLSGGSVALLVLGTIAQVLTIAIVAGAVALLCHRILSGRPFTRGAARAIIAISGALMIGTLLSQAFFGFAGVFIAEQLSGAAPVGDQFWPLALNVDGGPIIAGFVAGAIALAFELGERMQRDTEGLV